jgi:ubiquinone biosynthesis monooxygenase Coq7
MAGTKNRAVTLADRILKVDHAMVCRWFARPYADELEEFQSHEERYRTIFDDELARRSLRRCRGYWLCGFGGFVLGFATALCGRSAIAATTLDVERIVLKHLREQLAYLENVDSHAYNAVSAILADEQAHHDRSQLLASEGGFWPRILAPVVSASTSGVIWIGMRA